MRAIRKWHTAASIGTASSAVKEPQALTDMWVEPTAEAARRPGGGVRGLLRVGERHGPAGRPDKSHLLCV